MAILPLNCFCSPSASVLLRCGDEDREVGDGGPRLPGGCLMLASPVLETGGTAGEAVDEEVGRFWKYCSLGSSSSKPPHGYTFGLKSEGVFRKLQEILLSKYFTKFIQRFEKIRIPLKYFHIQKSLDLEPTFVLFKCRYKCSCFLKVSEDYQHTEDWGIWPTGSEAVLSRVRLWNNIPRFELLTKPSSGYHLKIKRLWNNC